MREEKEQSAAAWAREASADALDNHRAGNAADDKWHRAAMREVRRRGKCGAMSRDGDSCERVKGHSAKLDHSKRLGAGTYARWNYDVRDPNGVELQ